MLRARVRFSSPPARGTAGRFAERRGTLARLLLGGVLGCILLWPARAEAYSWMIRHGYGGCMTCHADPSGGELLTQYGRIQSDLVLRMRYTKDSVSAAASEQSSSGSFDAFDELDELDSNAQVDSAPKAPAPAPDAEEEMLGASPSAGFLWGLFDMPEWLLLGGAYRHLTVYTPKESDASTFPMQIDVFGQVQFGNLRASGSIGVIKVEAGSLHGHAAQITTEQGDELNLVSRTHWLGWDFTPELMLRAGRLNLPYGVRVPEHVFWVRESTRTDRESDQQHGVALGYQGDWLRGEVMGILGNYQANPDRFRERGYSLYAEALVSSWAALGVSSLITRSEEDRLVLDGQSMVRQAHGVFARLAPLKPLALLLEGNALSRSRNRAGYVGMAQADFELIQGLHLLATGEVLDEGKPVSLSETVRGQGKPRFGGWLSVDWFFLPHCEARVDAVSRQGDPFQLLAQLHVFL